MGVVLRRSGDAVDLGFLPGDGEDDGGIQQGAEIESVVGEFPEVVGVQLKVAAERLLQAQIVLVAAARFDRAGFQGAEDVGGESAGAGGAGENQVLVVRGFQGARVGGAEDRAGALQQVGCAEPRFGGSGLAQTVVPIEPQAGNEREMPQGDRVLYVEGVLVHVGAAGEVEGDAAGGQIVGGQSRLVGGESGLGDAQRESLVQARLHELHAGLDVVDLVHVVVIGADSVVGEAAVFAHRGGSVREGIAGGVVIDLVAAQERVDGQQGAGAEGVLITGRDVVGEHLLTLVLCGLVVAYWAPETSYARPAG